MGNITIKEALLKTVRATKEYVDEVAGSIDTDNLVITNSISIGRKEGTTIGEKSVAVGNNVEASGYASHAEGSNTEVSGYASHAEGHYSEASGDFSHAEGFATTASGDYSHAEGARTIASSDYQHVQGRFNIEDSTNTYAHIVGNGEDIETDEGEQVVYSNAYTLDWDGNGWFAGNVTIGADNKELATKEYVDEAAGSIDTDDLVVTNSISIGRKENSTFGTGSVAVGNDVEASGNYSHAEGNRAKASGKYSHAEGADTTASGLASHAEGYFARAIGYVSHAEGYQTEASNDYSHAEGYVAIASGTCSHAEGYYTTASSPYQHVQGKCNIGDSANTYAHIVGNGTSSSDLSNAHTLDWDGNAWFAGNLYVGGTSQDTGEKIATEAYTASTYITDVSFTGDSISYVKGDGTTQVYTSSSLKWGNPRSITIGNTAKNVDGSANVSWSLSEIGAFPVTGGTIGGSVYTQGDLEISGDLTAYYGITTLDTLNVAGTASFTDDVSISGDLYPDNIECTGDISANYAAFSNMIDLYPFNSENLENSTNSPGYGTIYCKYDTGETNVTSYADGYLSASYVDWLEFYGTETRWYRDYIVTTGNFVPYGSNSYTLGTSSLRWKYIYSNNSLNTSDRSDKENINYIRNNENDTRVLASDVDESKAPDITYSNLYEFVRDDLELATYNIKTSSEDEEENKTDINFIAQDLLYNLDGTDNTIGQLIVPPVPAPTDEEAKKYGEVDENGNKVCTPPALSYDVGNYVSVLAGALKETINKVEKQQETIDYLLSIIENK